jgi:ATP-dependent Zn protease
MTYDSSPTAHHEAGHAVVACALEVPFELVTIVPDLSRDMAGGVRSLVRCRLPG